MNESNSLTAQIVLRDAGNEIQSLFWGNSDGEGGLLCYIECCISLWHKLGAINRELSMELEKLASLQKTNTLKCQSLNAIFRLHQDLHDEQLVFKALMASTKSTNTKSAALDNFLTKINKLINSCGTTLKVLGPASALKFSNVVSSETESDKEQEIEEIRADLFVQNRLEREEYAAWVKAIETEEYEGCQREKLKKYNNEHEVEGEEDSVNTSVIGRPNFADDAAASVGAARAARPTVLYEGTRTPIPKLQRLRSVPLSQGTLSRYNARRPKRRISETRSTRCRSPRSVKSRKATRSVVGSIASQQALQDITQIAKLLKKRNAETEQIDTSSLSRFIQSRKAMSTTSTPSQQASLSIEQITKSLMKKNAKVDERDTMSSLYKFIEDRKSKASTPSLQASVSINKLAQQLKNSTDASKMGEVERAMSDSGWARKRLAREVENKKFSRSTTNRWDQMSIRSRRSRRKGKRSGDTSSRASSTRSKSSKRLKKKSSQMKLKSQCLILRDRLIKEFFDEMRSSGGSRGFGARRKKKDWVFQREFDQSEMVLEVDSVEEYLRF